MKTLQFGSRGKDVKWLQKKLGEHQDGIFGIKTQEAVETFQFLHDIKVDGIVGDITRKLLNDL